MNIADGLYGFGERDGEDDESGLRLIVTEPGNGADDGEATESHGGAEAQVLGEGSLATRVCGLHGAEVEVGEHQHGGGDGEPERELANDEGTAQLGKRDDGAPLADGVDDVAGQHPGEIGAQREPGDDGVSRGRAQDFACRRLRHDAGQVWREQLPGTHASS